MLTRQSWPAAPIDGGFAQRTAVCYFFNAGTTAVTLANPRILNLNGSAVSLTVNECGSGTLGVFKSCGIAATVSNSTIYSCKVTVTPSKQNVRGILRDAHLGPGYSSECRVEITKHDKEAAL